MALLHLPARAAPSGRATTLGQLALAELRAELSEGLRGGQQATLALLDEGRFDQALATVRREGLGPELDPGVVAGVLEAWGDAEPDRARRCGLYDGALKELARGMDAASPGDRGQVLASRRERVATKRGRIAEPAP